MHRLKSQATELSLVAFYADCRHEIAPLRSGHRVVLTYHLHLGESRGVALPAVPRNAVETLATGVRAHFETPVEKRWPSQESQPPERLVYLLDHEYSSALDRIPVEHPWAGLLTGRVLSGASCGARRR